MSTFNDKTYEFIVYVMKYPLIMLTCSYNQLSATILCRNYSSTNINKRQCIDRLS